MIGFRTGVRLGFVPPCAGEDGLPPVPVASAAVTGLAGAFSYLILGHVFAASQAGNEVWLAFALPGVSGFAAFALPGVSGFAAFALPGVSGFAAAAPPAEIGCLALGALAAGRLGRCPAGRRGLLPGVTAGLEALISAEAVTVIAVAEARHLRYRRSPVE
jgi:hypothetical protein